VINPLKFITIILQVNKMSLKDIIYETIHRNKKPIKQIADEIGVSDNYLYRICLPELVDNGSGAKFPLDLLVPVMNVTRNYSRLTHIAALCGCVVVKLPSFKSKISDHQKMIADYQKVTSDANGALLKFFEKPDSNRLQEVQQALDLVMEHSACNQKYIEKVYNGQTEIF